MHNRYILTDIGGVSFGVGLDDGADGETDEVTLLADNTSRVPRAQYMSPGPAFELVDALVIEGKRKLQPKKPLTSAASGAKIRANFSGLLLYG